MVQGLLVVDKEVGLTSHDVVQHVRRVYGTRQVGHAGTLDPVASGVLVLLVGSATRIAQYLQEDDKEYHLSMLLGLETDTQDITGAEVSRTDASSVTRGAFDLAVDRFRGTFMQVPPSYSAVKRNGQPLYRLARKGLPAEADPRRVTIYSMEAGSFDPPRAALRVVCSKGTYMRTLCHDIGRDLGVGGCMESLVRVRSGAFRLKDAVRLEELKSHQEPSALLQPAATGLPFPSVELPEPDMDRLMSGGTVQWPHNKVSGMLSVVSGKWLLALAESVPGEGSQLLAPRKILEPQWKELFKVADK